MAKNLYQEAAKIIKSQKIKHIGSLQTSQNMMSEIFEVVGTDTYSVRLWDVQMENKQIIHKSSCTCMRGSLINPKHNTICKHIMACQFKLVGNEICKF